MKPQVPLRVALILVVQLSSLSLGACTTKVSYLLSGHSTSRRSVAVSMSDSEVRPALRLRRGMAFGGFSLGLRSADTSIVDVDCQNVGRRSEVCALVGRARGTVRVDYLNRLNMGGDALDSFYVTVE